MVSVLKALVEKVDNMSGLGDTLSRDMETKKNNSVTGIKNIFSRLTKRFDMVEERANELENVDQ